MTDVANRVLTRLSAIFGMPKTDDPDVFFDEFRKAIVGYDAEVLEKAVDRWMRKDTAYWPRPGQLLAEARIVAADLHRFSGPRKAAEHASYDDKPQISEEQRQRVAAMMDKFRADMAARVSVEENKQRPDLEAGQKPAFEAMQDSSPNKHLHGLSPTSKRMTGERD